MILWRLVRTAHLSTALDGFGASLNGGRWNSKGLRAVYFSLDPATPVLETLTTFTRATAPSDGYRLLKVEYSGSFLQPPVNTLPKGWDRPDDAAAARGFGDKFLAAGSHGALLVPCVFLKSAINAVVNPAHADAATLKTLSSEEFDFDPRWPLG